MVAMARALMSRPKLMLMDEPSMGLAPILVERSFEIIQQVHESGVAVLVVEQNANVSLSIADRGYVLSTGRVVLEGQGGRPARGRGPPQGLPRPIAMPRVDLYDGISPLAGSPLALERLQLGPDGQETVGDATADVLLFVFQGAGAVDGERRLGGRRDARAGRRAGDARRARRRPRGRRASPSARAPTCTPRSAPGSASSRPTQVEPGKATGSRSFQVLFGPHNGSTRATLFVGYIPPGKAPWHYHLYDEIVWVWRGPGRFHLGDDGRGAPGRGGVPADAARGAHRREPRRRPRDGGARALHAGREPVGGLPHA